MTTSEPTRVLFVCMGNICRSPMAEAVFRHHVQEAGLSDQFEIDSAGTGGWHAGEPPDRRTVAVLQKHAIDPGNQRARQLRAVDFERFDYILAMDHENLRDMQLVHATAHKQSQLLLDFIPDQPVREVPDPYYDGGFEQVYQLVDAACRKLLEHIRSQER